MVVRTLPDERYGSPALRGALCQLNESAQNASQMPPRHACAALRCGACDGAAFYSATPWMPSVYSPLARPWLGAVPLQPRKC